MLPYWLIFVCLALGALLYGEQRGNRGMLLLGTASVVLILFIGLRYHVGGDWRLYQTTMQIIGRSSLPEALAYAVSDPAYSFLNWTSYQLGAGIWLPNLVCGALLIWGIMSLAVRQPNPWLVLAIAFPYLIIVVGMGYTRQSAAIGLTMVAITAVIDQKIYKFVAALIFATMFHKTAIIILPIIGLALSKNRFLTYLLLLVLGAILYQFFVSSRIDVLTRNYIEAQIQSRGAAQRLAINAASAIIFLIWQRQFRFSETGRRVWRSMSFAAIGALLALAVTRSSTVADRLGLYFAAVQLVILGRLPWALGGRERGRPLLMLLVILSSGTMMFIWLVYADNSRYWLPYRVYPL